MSNKIQVKINKVDDRLYYAIGLFSTMQIISVFNISLFVFISYIVLIYMLANRRCIKLFDNSIIIYSIIICMSTGINVGCSVLSDGYSIRTITSMLNMLILIFIYILASRENLKNFVDGFEMSCKVQLFWCVVQIICIKFLNFDINNFVFNRLLSMTDNVTQSREGELVCTGLHWHAANLIPIVIYLYCFSKSFFMKGLSAIVVLFTQNTTALITLGVCVVMDVLIIGRKIVKSRIKKISIKNLVIVLGCTILVVLTINRVLPYAIEKIEKVIYRFSALTGNLKGGEDDVGISSLTHLNYYRLLPEIILQNGPINAIIGYGVECSGFIYSQMYGQYIEIIWVIESDIVNTILNIGIIGFVVHYWLFMRLFLVMKREKKYWMFVLAILVGGITYNIQFNWLLFLMLALYGLYTNESMKIEKMKG